MSTVTQIRAILQQVLGQRADELARETQFVQRKSALQGADFVQGLVFAALQQGQPTSEQIRELLLRREVKISEPGLSQRFNERAAALLLALIHELVQEPLQAEQPAPVELLQRFEAVVVEESTTIRLPPSLASVWKGCGGGSGQSKAGIKLHVRWDLKQGRLQGPVLTDAKCSDQRSPLRQQGIAAGVLNITDEGYCSLEWLKQQEGFFLTRPRSTVVFLDAVTKEELDLEQIGPKVSNGSWQANVLVGREARLPARLILVRVPEEIIEQRQQRMRTDAARRGRQPNQEALRRAQWTSLITNVPGETLSLPEVIVLQRARWQIELLFKRWKQGDQIDEWRAGRRSTWRTLCELYAKIIAVLIEQWFLVVATWHDPYRSLTKAARRVHQAAPELLSALVGEANWEQVTTRLVQAMQACRLHRRGKHPCHAQLLLEGLDWSLT